jgi:hypothetical protein
MHTDITMSLCETRSAAIPAPPERVHAYMADPNHVPDWAPGFASAIRPEGEHWIATTAGGEAEIVVVADRAAGTVDILSAADRSRGAFARVIPNGSGCEVLFTLLFAPDTPAEAIEGQMRVVDDELDAIRQRVG